MGISEKVFLSSTFLCLTSINRTYPTPRYAFFKVLTKSHLDQLWLAVVNQDIISAHSKKIKQVPNSTLTPKNIKHSNLIQIGFIGSRRWHVKNSSIDEPNFQAKWMYLSRHQIHSFICRDIRYIHLYLMSRFDIHLYLTDHLYLM